MTTHVLYHANCYDGFGAAYAAWKFFGDEYEGKPVKYYPMYYKQELPLMFKGDNLIMVDYSRSKEEVLPLCMDLDSVIILDHHQTARDDLKGLQDMDIPNLTIVFNMNKSGALITWEQLHKSEPPMLIQHISDRDLWRFELEGTKEVHAALCAYPFDFVTWDNFYVPQLIEEGQTILRYLDNLVDRLCENIQFKEIGGFKVPIVNTCLLFSEVSSRLIELYPDYPFAAYYYDRKDGIRQYGLRSRDLFDVSIVAKRYGGGGHRNAAGFEVPL